VLTAVLVALSQAAFSYAGDPSSVSQATASTRSVTITGELLKIVGEFYIVRNEAGKLFRLHVDKFTKKNQVLKPGDIVEAQVTPKGHVRSITVGPSDR